MSVIQRIAAALSVLGFQTRSSEKYWELEFQRRKALATGKSQTGFIVTEETALTYTAVLAAVKVLSETISSLPLFTYRRLGDRRRELALDHPLFPILHDLPNEEHTSMTVRETLMANVLLWGNAFAEIRRDGAGNVRELWALESRYLTVHRINGRLAYAYQKPGQASRALAREQVFHVPGISLDGATGLSPIAAAREAIGLGLAAEAYGSRFFSNDASPGGVLEHPSQLSDGAHKHLRESIEDRHGGLAGAHKLMILEEGMKFARVGIPPDDAQFLETRKFQVAEIARIFRIPPHLLGDLERATFSNVEQQALEFVVHTIRPWLVRFEQAIKRDLVRPEERATIFAEHKVDGLLRGDVDTRYKAYATGRQWGWLSANDIRALENMNPIEKGDSYLIPMNMIPIGPGAPAISPAPTTDDSESAPGGGNGQARDLSLQAVAIGAPGASSSASQTVPVRAVLEGRLEHRGEQKRRELARSMRPVFREGATRILNRELRELRKAAPRRLGTRDANTWAGFLEEFYDSYRPEIARKIRPAFESLAALVVPETRTELAEETQAPTEETVAEFVTGLADGYAARHAQSSIGQLIQITRDSVEDPMAELEERLAEWEETRPGKDAERETVQGSSALAKMAFAVGGVTVLRWAASGKSCPLCNELDGQVAAIEGNFVPAGGTVEAEGASPLTTERPVGHPPLHQGCDCSIVPG